MKKKQRKPPYTGKLFITTPDKVERSVNLPSVEGHEIGARVQLNQTYKNLKMTIPLVRVKGGWDIAR